MITHFWHWLITSRYTRALEGEVLRLRAENRALVNSILGVAGVPPLKIEAATNARANGVVPAQSVGVGPLSGKPAAAAQREGALIPRAGSFAPVRRRSWQQIGRILEHKSKSSD